MATLSSPASETCCFQISNEFANLPWHKKFLSKIRIVIILSSARSRFQPSRHGSHHSGGPRPPYLRPPLLSALANRDVLSATSRTTSRWNANSGSAGRGDSIASETRIRPAVHPAKITAASCRRRFASLSWPLRDSSSSIENKLTYLSFNNLSTRIAKSPYELHTAINFDGSVT